MKILQFSDLHGDKEMLEGLVEYAEQTKPDVVICSGDILGQCLTLEEAEELAKSTNDLIRSKRVNLNSVNGTFKEEVAEFIEHVKFMAGADYKAAETYLNLEKKFEQEAIKQYEDLLTIFSKFKSPLLTVPGNWDSQHYQEIFQKFDIHKKMKDVDGVSFAGYGGTSDRIPFVPITKIIPYTEGDLELFLTKESVQYDSDVFVTHTPPEGTQDDEDNSGSEALSDATSESSPDLLLCGHAHKGLGNKRQGDTIVVNSGNVGDYLGKSGKGFFAEIEYDQVVDNTKVDHLIMARGDDSTIREYKKQAIA